MAGTSAQRAFSEAPEQDALGGTCLVHTCARIALSPWIAARTSVLPGTSPGRAVGGRGGGGESVMGGGGKIRGEGAAQAVAQVTR